MEVSILIPSRRPETLKTCIRNIQENTENIEYEILVDIGDGGTYKAVERIFKKAKGKYIVHIPDDCEPKHGWLNHMLTLMYSHDNDIFEGAFRTFNQYENPHGNYMYFNKKFAGFICIRKDVAEELGGLMDTHYTCFYGDPDLSLRVWNAGGAVEHAERSRIYYYDRHDDLKNGNISKYSKEDEDRFIKRWEPIFGRYHGCTSERI